MGNWITFVVFARGGVNRLVHRLIGTHCGFLGLIVAHCGAFFISGL